MFDSVVFNSVNSERNVLELGQAMKTKTPNLFVTFTVNMKKHFGIAPLFNAIEAKFPDKSSEQYKAACQLYMPIMLQMWNETINKFVDYLLISRGNIIKFGAGQSFKTQLLIFPHYHILIWLADHLNSIESIIQSTSKHLFAKIPRSISFQYANNRWFAWYKRNLWFIPPIPTPWLCPKIPTLFQTNT